MRPCRACGWVTLRQLPLGWCTDCWKQFLKGFAIALGASIAGHLAQSLWGPL